MNKCKQYIGIDPGSRGAIAVIDDNDGVRFLEDLSSDYSSYWYPTTILVNEDFYENYCVVEDVCGRPGQSCIANTTFMKLAGMAEYLGWYCADFEKFIKVKPQIWKKHFGLVFSKELTKTQKKHKSIELAKELFPSVADQLTASKDGRAEALLIAKYCQQLNKDLKDGIKR